MLGKFDKGFLRKVLGLPTASYKEHKVRKFILDYVYKLDQAGEFEYYQDDKGNVYITKGVPPPGKYYPCFAAHMDGARDFIKNKIVVTVPKANILIGYDADNEVQEYLAADDLVGVFVALSALRELDFVKASFFVEEEVGCRGSAVATMDFYNDCGYVLQSDRSSNKDVIFNAAGTIMASKAFKKKIKPLMKEYKMAFCTGSITDVMQLKNNGLNICALNIASAYFDAHMSTEFVDLDGLANIYKFIGELVRLLNNDRYEHQPEPNRWGSYYSNRDYYYDWYEENGYYQHWREEVKDWDKGKNYPSPKKVEDTKSPVEILAPGDYRENGMTVRGSVFGERLLDQPGVGTETLAFNLDRLKAKYDFCETCLECGKGLSQSGYEYFLCRPCQQKFAERGIVSPDTYPSVY